LKSLGISGTLFLIKEKISPVNGVKGKVNHYDFIGEKFTTLGQGLDRVVFLSFSSPDHSFIKHILPLGLCLGFQ
jgi:hypothetical protein